MRFRGEIRHFRASHTVQFAGTSAADIDLQDENVIFSSSIKLCVSRVCI